jgi:hypothetical protein
MSNVRLHRHSRRLRPGRPGPVSLPLAGLAAAAGLLLAGPGAAGAAAGACPSANPPNELVLVSGSPQTAQLGRAFPSNLQLKLANSNGCPLTGSLAGVTVTFVAPGGGASGTFASSGSNVASVGTDENGIATAPPFTANHTAGSYGVYAESNYGSLRFDLTNSATGVPASIAADGQATQEATINNQYALPLQARVRDGNGKPVADVSVTFAIASGPTGASASFLGGSPQATALTDADGLATSPALVANASPGRFTATATTANLASAATYSLTNHAAATTLAAIGETRQQAAVGSRYPRPLRARVLDPSGRPIEGVTVTFTLPQISSGAGASFLGGSNQATDLTDANGQASSPPLLANDTAGRFAATATATGSAKPLSYPLRNVAGRLTATRAPQQAAVGTRYRRPLRARLLDPSGRPI